MLGETTSTDCNGCDTQSEISGGMKSDKSGEAPWGPGDAYAAPMQRVLLVQVPGEGDPDGFSAAARALRDAGHEVVHGGETDSPGQVSAVAWQEDVDLVLLIGRDGAGVLAEALQNDDDGPGIAVVNPGSARADALAATDR